MPNARCRPIVLAVILAILVYGVIASMLGTIMPSFRLSDGQNGSVALAQALGLMIASVSAGPLIDRKGKKVALLMGLSLITVSLFALPRAEAFGIITLLFFVLGTGGGVMVTAANALASDLGGSQRSSMLNLLNLFFGLGGLATPFVAANFLGGDAVRLCYLAATLAAITLMVNALTSMPRPAPVSRREAVPVVFFRPALFLLGITLFLYVSCEVGVWNWLSKYLISRGVPEKQALNILSLGFALGLLLGRAVVSRILMRISAIDVTLASATLMAITTYLMLNTGNPALAGIAVFCAGLAMAPVFPTTLGIVGDAFPRRTATAMGLVITCGWMGLAISSRIIGSIANSASLGKALLLIPAFSVLMILVNLMLRTMVKPAR